MVSSERVHAEVMTLPGILDVAAVALTGEIYNGCDQKPCYGTRVGSRILTMFELRVRTTRRTEARDITGEVMQTVKGRDGSLLHLFCTHTTCGLLINENADPDVMKDLLEAFERLAPRNYGYAHGEGNSDAHIKSSLTGHSLTIPFHEGKPVLGTWQGIYLMEFDGPRERRIILTLV